MTKLHFSFSGGSIRASGLTPVLRPSRLVFDLKDALRPVNKTGYSVEYFYSTQKCMYDFIETIRLAAISHDVPVEKLGITIEGSIHTADTDRCDKRTVFNQLTVSFNVDEDVSYSLLEEVLGQARELYALQASFPDELQFHYPLGSIIHLN